MPMYCSIYFARALLDERVSKAPAWDGLLTAVACCSVNTPTKIRGVGAGKAADLTYWEKAARMIANVSTSSKIVVEKSTVPVKTAEAIEKVRWIACLQHLHQICPVNHCNGVEPALHTSVHPARCQLC